MMDMGKYLCSVLAVEKLESEGDRGQLTNYNLESKDKKARLTGCNLHSLGREERIKARRLEDSLNDQGLS